MKSRFAISLVCLLLAFCMQSSSAMAQTLSPLASSNSATWPQWGQNPQRTGMVNVAGDTLDNQVASTTYDPFVPQEQAANGGELLTHYQAPELAAGKVYMMVETGTFDPNNARTRTWHEQKLNLSNGSFTVIWDFASDWYPEDPVQFGGWEPVFSPAITGSFIYVPGADGTVWKLNTSDGTVASHIDPFGDTSGNLFVSSPLTADSSGNIYYNAIHFTDANNLFGEDVIDAWVVKIATNNSVSKVSYSVLVPNAPTTTCEGVFAESQLPWPPSPTAVPPQGLTCGKQRPGVNASPAIGTDGTIYTVSRAHFNSRFGFVVAVNPDLTPKWASSLRGHLNDGCGVLIPIQSKKNVPEKGKCNFGAPIGVEPETNHAGTARIIDMSSSSPTVLPDGVLYGAYSRYNIARGHLMKFDFNGNFVASFDFGWDSTPAVLPNGGSYSIVIKDNHYDEEAGFYCNPSSSVPVSETVCASTGIPAGPFYITQLSPTLVPQWKFHNITFTSDHPNGFEWCINAPAIDANGFVYVNSEDGNIYRIPQGHTGVFDISTAGQKLFLKVAIGAAYTPLSINSDGTIFTENDGVLFAIR